MRGIKKLTVTRIARLKKPGRYCDGGGLYLQIARGGTKSWIFRYMRRGKEHNMGLGPLHAVNMRAAREAARHARTRLAQGHDPLEDRRLTAVQPGVKNKTFNECMTGYIASHRVSWKSGKYAQQWEKSLRDHICPHFGMLHVRQLNTGHVQQALEPVWATRTVTATRLRGRIERVLAWAKISGYREGENPAHWRWHLEELLPAPARVRKVRHFPSIPYQKIGAFFVRLARHKGTSARALAFTILTACRRSEAVHARWDEIDFGKAVWTIPAERMKAGRDHRVPLSRPVLDILRAQQGQDPVWVFPGTKLGSALSADAMLVLLRRMGPRATVHGFRSSFRVWAAEQTVFPKEVPELALAHTVGSMVELAYQRSDLFERRRALMQEWADWCLVA